jgi:hypothetical protein
LIVDNESQRKVLFEWQMCYKSEIVEEENVTMIETPTMLKCTIERTLLNDIIVRRLIVSFVNNCFSVNSLLN